MPRADGSIVIDTKVDRTGLRRGLRGVRSMLGGVAKAGTVAMGALAAGAGAATAAFVALGKQGEAAATANARIGQIAESMGLFGDQADNVRDRLIELAEQQARITGISQDTVKETQAILLTFAGLAQSADEVGGAFDRATQAALDLQAAGFGDAASIAKQLGRALNDPVTGLTALTRSGITFTEAEKELIKAMVEAGDAASAQAFMLEAIEKQVGGTAEATANATDQIKVAWSQLAQDLGTIVMPTFTRVLEGGIEAMDEAHGPLTQAVQGLMALVMGEGGSRGFQEGLDKLTDLLVDGVTTVVPRIVEIARTVIVALAQAIPSLLPPLADALLDGIEGLADALPQVVPALVTALADIIGRIAQSAGPIARSLGEALVAGVDALTEAAPGLVDAVVTMLQGVLEAVVRLVPELIPALIELGYTLLAALVEVLPDLQEVIMEFGIGIVEALTDMYEANPVMFHEPTFAVIQAIAEAIPRFAPLLAEGTLRMIPTLADAMVRVGIAMVRAMAEEMPRRSEEIGRAMVEGIVSGFKAQVAASNARLKESVSGMVGSVKDFLGIRSPSRLMEREVGAYLPRGIAVGFAQAVPQAARMMRAAFMAEMSGFQALGMAAPGGNTTLNITVDARGAAAPEPVAASAYDAVRAAMAEEGVRARILRRTIA